jgi:hypothetical protein
LDSDIAQWWPTLQFSRASVTPILALLPNFLFAFFAAPDLLRFVVLAMTFATFFFLLSVSVWRFSVVSDRKSKSKQRRAQSNGPLKERVR